MGTGAGKETTARSQGREPGGREAREGSGSTPPSPTVSAAHPACGARPGFPTGGRGARRKVSWPQSRTSSGGGGDGGKGRGRNGRKGRRQARSMRCLIGTSSSVPLLLLPPPRVCRRWAVSRCIPEDSRGVRPREGRITLHSGTAERTRGTRVGRGPHQDVTRDVAATCSVRRSRGARRGRGGAEGFSGGRVGRKHVACDRTGRRLRAEGAVG
jgi:hypothetical protein